MNNCRTALVLFGLLIVGTGSVISYWHLRNENRLLRPELIAAKAQIADTEVAAADNRRLEAIVTLAEHNRSAAERALKTEVETARAEVKAMETRAEQIHAEKVIRDRMRAESLQTNRDLQKGLVLVENCMNVGNQTPADAFQTLIWAAANGNDQLAQSLLAINGPIRAAAEAVLATLPDSLRSKYPTPESFAALFVANVVNDVSALQILEQKATDPVHVTLSVGKMAGSIGEIPLERGPDGWRVTIDTGAFEKINRRLLGRSSGR
jgi:hypothetical protein